MEGKSTKIWNIILTKFVLGDLIKWLFSCHKQENKHHHKHLLIQKPELAQQHDQSYQEGSSSRSTGNQQPSETGSAVLRDENLFNHKFHARQFGMKILKDWAEMVGIKVMFALFLKSVIFSVNGLVHWWGKSVKRKLPMHSDLYTQTQYAHRNYVC